MLKNDKVNEFVVLHTGLEVYQIYYENAEDRSIK